MVQTVKSLLLQPGQQAVFIEKPHALSRIFVRIAALLLPTQGYVSWISFDDPSFYDYYSLVGSAIYFEAKGEGIFQGNIWVRNHSSINIVYTATEILV